jgi:hypothetical protein
LNVDKLDGSGLKERSTKGSDGGFTVEMIDVGVVTFGDGGDVLESGPDDGLDGREGREIG